jgi:hypothetical protein
MRKTYQHPNRYRFIHPPQALRKAKQDTIVIIPASMLPLTKTIQQVLSNLPKGSVFLCHAKENTKQRRVLERVEAAFRQYGHAVTILPMEQVI